MLYLTTNSAACPQQRAKNVMYWFSKDTELVPIIVCTNATSENETCARTASLTRVMMPSEPQLPGSTANSAECSFAAVAVISFPDPTNTSISCLAKETKPKVSRC